MKFDQRSGALGLSSLMFSGRFRLLQPKFVAAFQELARLATKRGVEGGALVIDGLLVALSKADIVRRGTELGVDYSMTVWCYQADGDGRACGRGDSCRLRRGGFAAAGVPDSTRYVVRN